MEIFSNWVFWVVLASIVFVLALIGYLTESMKKPKEDKKEEKEEEPIQSEPTVEPVQPEPTVTPAQDDNWMTMPEVNKPLEEVKVDTINEVPADSNVVSEVSTPSVSDNVFTTPVNSDTPAPVTSEPAGLNVETSMTNVENPSVSSNDNTVTSEVSSSTQDVPTSVSESPVTTAENLDIEENNDKNSDIWNL